MTKYFHILGFIICFWSSTIGQYSRSLDIHLSGERGLNAIQINDGIYVSLSSRCDNFTVDCSWIIEIDHSGIIGWTKNFSWLDPGSRLSLFNTRDTLMLSGHTNGLISGKNIELEEISPSGDSIRMWRKETEFQEWNAGVIKLNSHYYFTTREDREILDQRVKLYKLDQELNLVEEKTIIQGLENPITYGMKPTLDSNFIFSFSYYNPDNYPFRTYALYKVSPDLEILWKYNDGATDDPEQTYGTALHNGGYAMTASLDSFTPTNNRFRPKINFLDSLGNQVDQIHFIGDFSVQQHLGNIITAKNGDIIGIGFKRNYFPREIVTNCGWLFRISQEGELLWERNIIDMNIIPPDGFESSGIFTNLTEMDDGSILIVGQIYDRFEDGSLNPNVWLLKLDENGCYFPDCGEDQFLTTSTLELAATSQVVTLYPNPAQDELHFQFTDQTLLKRILIFDNMGRLVQKKDVDLFGIDFIVPFGDLESGVYFVQLWTEEGLVVRKVFVE